MSGTQTENWGSPSTLYGSDFLPLLMALYSRSTATSGNAATAAQNSPPTSNSPIGDLMSKGGDGSTTSQNDLSKVLGGTSGSNLKSLLGGLGSSFGLGSSGS